MIVVVAGALAAGRPPLGSPGWPPHGPESWQGAWVSDWSSGLRRSAWRPDHTSGTPQTPWPCPSSSAARNSRSRRSDTHRWPHNPPEKVTVGGVGTGSLFYAPASPSSREDSGSCQHRDQVASVPYQSARRRPVPTLQGSPGWLVLPGPRPLALVRLTVPWSSSRTSWVTSWRWPAVARMTSGLPERRCAGAAWCSACRGFTPGPHRARARPPLRSCLAGWWRAPAACWWARTTLPSTKCISQSSSPAASPSRRVSTSRWSKTPWRRQR